MSNPKFKRGDKAKVKYSNVNKKVAILAGPDGEDNVYWTLDEHGSYDTYIESLLHPVPCVVFSEAHFEAIKNTLNPNGYGALMNDGSERIFFDRLRRDYGEEAKT